MKRINSYKKLFKIEKEIDLRELKSSYRTLVKEWHPDKFREDDEKAAEAELKSREIIEGYHFLVSISEDTKAANLEEYTQTLAESAVVDYEHKGQRLTITFLDGSVYEYFGVNRAMFNKFINSDNLMRFGRRNIFNSYIYRKSKKALQEA